MGAGGYLRRAMLARATP